MQLSASTMQSLEMEVATEPKDTEWLASETGSASHGEGPPPKVSRGLLLWTWSLLSPPGYPQGLRAEPCRGEVGTRDQETKREISNLIPLFCSVSWGIRGKQKPLEKETSTSFVSPQTLARKPRQLTEDENKYMIDGALGDPNVDAFRYR